MAPIKLLIRCVYGPTLTMLQAWGLVEGPAPWVPVESTDDIGLMPVDPCDSDICADRREVYIDYDALGVEGIHGGEWVSYDYSEVVGAITAPELATESEISLAVRLLISEIGADRLLMNRFGLLEAVGILYTVDNRLDPLAYNPESEGNAPTFPGCAPGDNFYTCANAQQYLGMATWRALSPERHYDPTVLEQAADVAVAAWWLQEHGWIEDFTEGATNYVHRCGAAAYGLTTHHCDAHIGNPARDVRGANPFTGPIVFKAPTVFLNRKGFYGLYESRRIEFDPWWDVEGLDGDGLVDADAEAVLWESETPEFLPSGRFPGPDPLAADAGLRALIEAWGAPQDQTTVEHLLRAYSW